MLPFMGSRTFAKEMSIFVLSTDIYDLEDCLLGSNETSVTCAMLLYNLLGLCCAQENTLKWCLKVLKLFKA